MIQFLKDHVRQAIIEAALHEFAEQGFSGASIAKIAARAGVSTGNVYRYFTDKDKLFEAAIPKSFVMILLEKTCKRVDAYPVGKKAGSNFENTSYAVLSEELLEFAIENRLQVLVILEGAKGTVYETFANTLRAELTKKLMQKLRLTANFAIMHALIDELYGNFLHALGSIFRKFSDSSDIKTAVQLLTTYHLGGLAMLAN